ncbi:MAG: hypothetical protein M3512_05190 [Bacteroidota bacterium]|nr:hypothetical protein [Bacteroidota bacterium]
MSHLAFEESSLVYAIDEIRFEYDLGSFFDFYKVINAKALSERIGMNQSMLAQYIKGIKKTVCPPYQKNFGRGSANRA